MKKLIFGLILGVLIVGFIGMIVAESYREGVIIITTEDNVTVEELNDLVASYNLTWEEGSPITTYGPLRGYVIVLEGEEQSWIEIFESESIIKSVSLSPIVHLCDCDNLGLCTGQNECETAGGYWYDSACNEEENEFCGTSTLGSCESDDDCETRGCSGSVCGSINDDTSNTGSSCIWWDCYDDEKYNKECGCVDNQCQWKDKDDVEDNETGKGRQGLGQIIRGRVKAGIYTSPTGEQIRVRELAQNRFLLQVNNVSADCGCELEEETENNKTKLSVKLSNGRKAEIKIMPDVASERVLERLRLKFCSAENNCSIELKEVGSGNKTQLAYELQVERHSKLLWIFRKKMQVKAQINAETGDIIRIKKPWWAFLASEPKE